MVTTPTASWSLHPPVIGSAFELPLLRADVTSCEDSSTHASKAECVTNSSSNNMANIKEERLTPEPPVPEKNELPVPSETIQPLDSVTATDQTTIRVRDNLTSFQVSQDPIICVPNSLGDRNVPPSLSTVQQQETSVGLVDYSGLQLLSDSIERFVSADQSKLSNPPETIKIVKKEHCSDKPVTVEMAGNALDVLCAAALYQQSDPPSSSSEPREILPDTSCPRPAGFQVEFDFRSKLAELQRKYKEKQKELSSLSK